MGVDFNPDATLALRRGPLGEEAAEYARQQRHRAARVLAGTHARDGADCAFLLDALGLTAAEGKARA